MRETIVPVGDSALEILFTQEVSEDGLNRVMAVRNAISAARIPVILEMVPGYASILITYDPIRTTYSKLQAKLVRILQKVEGGSLSTGTCFEIPVCYGGTFGEDLSAVANHTGLSEKTVVELHASVEYRIHFLGFLPGFPYLGGLDERLTTPRRKTPRTLVPAGSVGIGGAQTGIYPFGSPGGWQLIGKTPLRLFDPQKGIPYAAGDRIRFLPITEEEFSKLEGVSIWDWK